MKKNLTIVLLIVALFPFQLVYALETLQSPPTSVNDFYPVKYRDDGIIITVMSNGCKRKNDFLIMFKNNSDLIVKRLKKDKCRAKARPIKLFYSFDELGIRPVYLL